MAKIAGNDTDGVFLSEIWSYGSPIQLFFLLVDSPYEYGDDRDILANEHINEEKQTNMPGIYSPLKDLSHVR